MSPEKMQLPESAADSDEASFPETSRDGTWCASLTRFLHLFDRGPEMRVPLIDANNPVNTVIHRKLLSIGALRPAPESSLLDCPVCRHTSVRPLPARQRSDFDFYCSHCEKIVDVPDDPHLLALSPDWLFGELARAFDATPHSPALPLLSGHLWEIGEFTLRGRTVNLLFARVDNLLAVPKICGRLAKLPKHAHHVVLCSWHSLVIEGMAVAGKRVFADLHAVARLEFSGLSVDVPAILARFAPPIASAPRPLTLIEPPKAPVPSLEVAPDGSWVSVNGGRRVYLRGKQRRFMLAMVEEYRKGNQQPVLEQVMLKAGYRETVSGLHHVSKRAPFLALFGRANGLIWFKGLVTPR